MKNKHTKQSKHANEHKNIKKKIEHAQTLKHINKHIFQINNQKHENNFPTTTPIT